MPQLKKGEKYVFGWTAVGKYGAISLPEGAANEYGIGQGEQVIILPGSRTSGGFSLAKMSRLRRSKLPAILMKNPDFASLKTEEGKTINIEGKSLCWITIREKNKLRLPLLALEAFGIKPGDRLHQ
jgi:hypothetical protein